MSTEDLVYCLLVFALATSVAGWLAGLGPTE